MLTKDIKHRRGTRKSLRFEITGNLSGREISFVVKPSTGITDARVIDKNNLKSGEIELLYNDASNRTGITVNIIEEDTYSLTPGNYIYDLDDLTSSITLVGGVFILSADVQTPFDNLDSLPRNCKRAVLAMPDEFTDNSFVYKVTDGEKKKFTGLSVADAKTLLGVDLLENNKIDKVDGKGLSETDVTSQMKYNYDAAFAHITAGDNPHCVTKDQIGLGNVVNVDASNPANITQSPTYRFSNDSEKSNWNSAYSNSHAHTNKTNLDSINQGLAVSGAPQFNQLGLGRAAFGIWSLALQSGLTTKSGTSIDWEGGNARLRETAYNLEFFSYDGSNLVMTFKTGAAGNFSYKPLSTNGQSYKTSSVSANTTLTASDHVVLVTTSSSDKTITLPVTGIADGTLFFIKKTDSGSGKVIIQGASGTIDGQSSVELSGQNNVMHLIKNGTNYWILGKYI